MPMRNWVQHADLATLAQAVTCVFLALTVAGTLAGYLLEFVFSRRRIWALPLDPGQLRGELLGNLVFLAVIIPTFTVVLAGDVVRYRDDTGFAVAGTFVAIFVTFQIYYYGLHRALHHRRLVRFHRWHHRSRITTPLSGQSMSFVEALGWMGGYVAVPAALSYISPISFDGWALYIAYNVLGNISGHANVEPIPRIPGLRYTSLISNVFTYHALHHARWTGNYGFATTLMDRICHTEWPDWSELHAHTAHGDALTNLRARGESFATVDAGAVEP